MRYLPTSGWMRLVYSAFEGQASRQSRQYHLYSCSRCNSVDSSLAKAEVSTPGSSLFALCFFHEQPLRASSCSISAPGLFPRSEPTGHDLENAASRQPWCSIKTLSDLTPFGSHFVQLLAVRELSPPHPSQLGQEGKAPCPIDWCARQGLRGTQAEAQAAQGA